LAVFVTFEVSKPSAVFLTSPSVVHNLRLRVRVRVRGRGRVRVKIRQRVRLPVE